MTKKIVWKTGYYTKADPVRVAAEIASLGATVSPREILELARDPETELHGLFEWDDTVAAEKWRLQQARVITCNLAYIDGDRERDAQVPLRIFHQTGNGSGYKQIGLIMRDAEDYQNMLISCRRALDALKAKYGSLTEYDEIWELIR